MSPIESLIFMLGAAALLAQFARVLKVPYPVFLVLGGLVIGFVPGLPTIEISPEVIFLVFLPPLLNYAAFFSSPGTCAVTSGLSWRSPSASCFSP